MATEEIDPTIYVRSPILDVASGVALGVALLAAVPKDASDTLKKNAKRLRKEVLVLQEAWSKSDAQAPTADRRLADARVDNGWGALLDRLEAYAALPLAMFPKAARARLLVDLISPNRGWFNLPFAAQWAESNKRIERIDDEGLAADIDALAGKEFLVEVRSAHAEYGAALGMKGPLAHSDAANLSEPLRALALAVARYSRAVIGELDDENAASVARTRSALRPIEDHRAGQARRSQGAAAPAEPAPVTPVTPVPEVV